jgi:hypothetical protein
MNTDAENFRDFLSGIVGRHNAPPEDVVTGSYTGGALPGNGDVGVAVGAEPATGSERRAYRVRHCSRRSLSDPVMYHDMTTQGRVSNPPMHGPFMTIFFRIEPRKSHRGKESVMKRRIMFFLCAFILSCATGYVQTDGVNGLGFSEDRLGR